MPTSTSWRSKWWALQVVIDQTRRKLDEGKQLSTTPVPTEQPTAWTPLTSQIMTPIAEAPMPETQPTPIWSPPALPEMQEQWTAPTPEQPNQWMTQTIQQPAQPVVSQRRVTQPVVSQRRVTQPIVTQPSPQATAMQPTTPTVTGKPIAWWEKPAEITNKAMTSFGQALANVPLLGKVMSWTPIQKLFEGAKNVEEYWASIVTAPWSPSLPQQAGENWLQHQKREYENWDAPTYVKGGLEFAMPLYWLPYVGWLGKASRALGITGKVTKTMVSAGTKAILESKTVSLVTREVEEAMFHPNNWRKLAWAIDRVPVIKQAVKPVIEAIFSPYVFVRPTSHLPKDIMLKEIMMKRVLEGTADGLAGRQTFPMLAISVDGKKLLGILDNGLVPEEIVKAPTGVGQGFTDIFEGYARNPVGFEFATPEVKAYVEATAKGLNELHNIKIQAGLAKMDDPIIMNRTSLGQKFPEEVVMSDRGAVNDLARVYKTMEEGIKKNGVIYETDPIKAMRDTAEYTVRHVATKRFDDAIGKYGKTPKEWWADIWPVDAAKKLDLETEKEVYKSALDAAQRALRKEVLPGATREKIRRIAPDVAAKMDAAYQLSPESLDQILGSLTRDLKRVAKITPQEVKVWVGKAKKIASLNEFGAPEQQWIMQQANELIKQATISGADVGGIAKQLYKSLLDTEWWKQHNITQGLVEDAVKLANKMQQEGIEATKENIQRVLHQDYLEKLRQTKLGIDDLANVFTDKIADQTVATQFIGKAYRSFYRGLRAEQKTAFEEMRDLAKGIITSAEMDLKPLEAKYNQFMQKFEGSEVLDYGHLATIPGFPAFNNKFFPMEMTKVAEKYLANKGQEWLRKTAAISAASRTTTASLDWSAPWLQGLVMAATNPREWAKSVIGMIKYTAKPQVFYQEMLKEMDTLTEMIKYGYSAQAVDWLEAMKGLKTVAGGVPKVGGFLKGVVQQTYGRTEVAWVGWGEMARIKLFKAMRKEGMTPEQLTDVVRTVSLMTGTLPSSVMGVGKTQQQVENSFVFFAPRYTRAGLSMMGDMLKGGISGQTARESLAHLMQAGLLYYYGATKVLGQEMNLDPRSGRFMTIKVGNQHLGVGGIYTAMMRLSYNAALQTVSDPTSFITPEKWTRYDNPFIKFMMDRTSPLTGTTISLAVEHKDYYGRPFETPGDWGGFILSKIEPIALQNIGRTVQMEGAFAPVPVAAQLAGLRQFPKSAWELRDDERNRLAKEQSGVTYEELPKIEQRRIDQNPTIKALQVEADTQTLQQGKKLNVAFYNLHQERKQARDTYANQLKDFQTAVDMGLLSPYDFRKMMQDQKKGLAATYEHINNLPQYKEARELEQNPKNLNMAVVEDVATQELWDAMNSGQFEDQYTDQTGHQFGIFNFDKYYKFKDDLRTKYGDAVYRKMEVNELEANNDLPPLALEYMKAQKVLRPYWEVQNWAEKNYGERWANSSRGQAFISRMRKTMRRTNAEIAKYYDLFYKQPELTS